MKNFDQFVSTVQANCDIVDAVHAQDYGLCIYLLKMRDYYRWKNNIPLTEQLENSDVHAWIQNTEEYWEKIANDKIRDITLDDEAFSAFDTEKINQKLSSENLVYSGGLGHWSVPLFILAKLEKKSEYQGFTIFTTSDEYARGLYGSPGLYMNNTIIVRKEALTQFLWAYYDEWSFSRLKNTMGRAMSFYPFKTAPEKALHDMTENELHTLTHHEIGEGLIGREFGAIWNEMILDFHHTKTEILLRATKDLAVDCLTTLPFLLSEQREASLFFYFALFSDMRKEVFPELYNSFKAETANIDYSHLLQLTEKGRIFWYDIGKTAIDIYKQDGKEGQQEIDNLIESAVCT